MVTEARARGREELENGDLLREAERRGSKCWFTTDKNLSFQQSLKGRKIAIVALGLGRWSLIRHRIPQVVAAVNAASPGSFAEVEIPHEQ
jgi:hypothetical protein